MASIRERKRADGSTAHMVRWREGGQRDGKPMAETLNTAKDAREFRRAVEEAGEHLPLGWTHGVGYLDEIRTAGVVPVEHDFIDFGMAYTRLLTDAGPDCQTRYAQQINTLAGELYSIMERPVTIEGIRSDHIREWINKRKRMKRGGAAKTIRNYHGLLFAVMADAVQRGVRPSNPCVGYRLPKVDDADHGGAEEKVFLTEAMWMLLYTYLDADVTNFCAATVGTGMRFGEISALKIRDLELDAPVPMANIRRAWKKNGTGEWALVDRGRFYLGKTKGKQARRITLCPEVVEVFRRAIKGREGNKDDPIFTATRGGRLDQGHFYENRWQPAVERAQRQGLSVDPRFHDLRHTHAAWLISANVPLPVIQQRLGHRSIVITVDTYGGLLVQPHEVADAAIQAAMTGGRISIAPPVSGPVTPAAQTGVTYDADDVLPDDGDDADEDDENDA